MAAAQLATVGSTVNREVGPPHLRSGRALHLLDLDNLVGGVDIMTTALIADVYRAYDALVQQGDDIVVAVDHRRLGMARTVLQRYGVTLLPGIGQDGADNALLAEAVRRSLGGRATRWLVIASGDRAFAPLGRLARRSGKRIWLVNGAGLCSRELRSIANVRSDLRHARTAADAARETARLATQQAMLAIARATFREGH